MPSEYDALLEPPPNRSDYDALLSATAAVPSDDLTKYLVGPGFGEKPPPPTPNLAGQILENAATGIARTAEGFVPHSVYDAAKMLTPAAGAPEEIVKSGRALSDILFGGKGVEETDRKYSPENFALADADKTPAFSKERFTAGFGTLAQLLMGGGIVHGLPEIRPRLTETLFPTDSSAVALAKAEIPPTPKEVTDNASQITSAAGLPREQIRPGLDEEASLRQPGQTPETHPETEKTPQEITPSVPSVLSVPSPATSAARTFRGPADAFGSEVTPVASYLIDNVGGLLSKSAAMKAGRFAGNEELWDGAQDALSHPTHNKVYNPSGETPDAAAAALFEAGLIKDPYPDSMWEALRHESQTSRTVARQTRAEAQAAEAAHAEWQDQLKQGERDPVVQLMTPDGQGAAVIVRGENGKGVELHTLGENGDTVASATHDTLDAALKSAHEQGLLLDEGGQSGRPIFSDEAARPASAGDSETPQQAQPAPPEIARLRSGENQGDLLANQTEDLKLVGEKGTDYSALQAAAEASDKAKAESDATQQGKLFAPEESQNGVAPAEKVIAGSSKPELAREMTPQALGVIHPLPGFIKNITDYFTSNTPSQIWNTIKGSLDASLGKTFAKTTIASRDAGEAGARWISAKIAAPHLADTFASQVLDGTGVDPVKFGAALTEDNLASVKAEFEHRAEEAFNRDEIVQQLKEDLGNLKDADIEDPAIQKQISHTKREINRISKLTDEAGDRFQKSAQNVTSIIGSKNSPFKTETEYEAFLKDPATQTALDRHRSLWAETIDPMFKKAQLLEPDVQLPSRGLETGARINLYNDTEATGKDVVGGTGKGNLTATFRKKSPFAIQAKGTGQSYNVNYFDQMANTFGRQLEISAKNDFETKLVDSGNAVIGKPGEAPTLPDGEKTVAFPLKRTVLITAEDGSKIPVNQNIYIRKSLAAEYRNAANVDRYDVPAVVKAFASAANKSALAGLTDASVHGLNLMTALFTRPSIVGSVLSDSLLSTFGRADVPVTIVKVFTKALQDNRAQIADLAQIGAMRSDRTSGNPLAKFIQVADRTTRLLMDDTFKKMADAGLVENTETNRREFVNQVGQYNIKAQGGLRRIARETGFGPFATAGTTFNTLGLRTAAMSPGVTATSPMAAAALRANVVSKWIGGLVVLPMTLNYLLTKDKGGGVMGRPGVPIGSIDTGMDDQNGRPLSFSVANLLGLGRALRVTGARGFIESQRKGLNLSTALDASARDIVNSSISPFAGPVVRFGTEVTTGYQPAINVGRSTHVAAPGENQLATNLHDAIMDANPILKSIQLAHEPGGTLADSIRQQIPRMSLQPTQRPEFIEKYPEIVHKAQASAFIDDVVRRARNMKPEARTQFVNDSLDKLSDEDRAHAEKTLKYRKIDY